MSTDKVMKENARKFGEQYGELRYRFKDRDDLCRYMVKTFGDTLILSFSNGKDAVAAWLWARRYWKRIVPFYMYIVPDLEFIEEGLTYYEKFFGEKIIRVPHRWLYNTLDCDLFQPPHRFPVIQNLGLGSFDYDSLLQGVRYERDLDEDTFCGDGVRAEDNTIRRVHFAKHGPINYRRHKCSPVYDLTRADMLRMFRAEGVKLPVDYMMFGRSFESITDRFLPAMRKYYPRDYERIKEWFPMCDLMEVRRRYAEAHFKGK